jgi:hypothetical protein
MADGRLDIFLADAVKPHLVLGMAAEPHAASILEGDAAEPRPVALVTVWRGTSD